MITQPDSPSAEAFTVAAKNIAAQCSIQASKRYRKKCKQKTTPTAS